MPEPERIYLDSTRYLDFDHASIEAKAAALTSDADPLQVRATRLFQFVRDGIRYDPRAPMLAEEDYVASTILARGAGYCTQKAVLLAALSRCAGVPCKLCFANIRNYIVPGDLLDLMGTNLFTYHGYNALLLDGRWVKATPAFDTAMCEKHGFVPVEFDGVRDGVFHPTDRTGRRHIEYIEQLGCRGDVPYAEIINAFAEVYGPRNPELKTLMAGRIDGE